MNNPLPSGLSNLTFGDIINTHTDTPFGRAMGHSLDGRQYQNLTGCDSRQCPSHSMLVVPDAKGNKAFGDVTFPVARWMPMDEFTGLVTCGHFNSTRLLRVAGTSVEQRMAMAKYWDENIHYSFYNIFAYP